MAYDFQKEHFNLRLPRNNTDQIPEEVVKVGEALWQHKVKLNATLARMRVKENAQSVTELIPNPDSRGRFLAYQKQPCYARVNTKKVDNIEDDVIAVLHDAGYTKATTREQIQSEKRALRRRQRDLLEFSADCRDTIDSIDLVKNGCIVLQVS